MIHLMTVDNNEFAIYAIDLNIVNHRFIFVQSYMNLGNHVFFKYLHLYEY